jgi:hypothetical protein
MPLFSRGLIYAPARFVVAGRRIAYQPLYVMEPDFLMGALFVRKGSRTYYFGNWFEPAYAGNYVPWVTYYQGTTKRFLDVNFKYYRVTTVEMKMSNWERKLTLLYQRRASGLVARPPISLDQQKRALSRLPDGTDSTAVARDLNLSHLKTVRTMRSSATARSFEITYLSSLAYPKAGKEVNYPIREVENLVVVPARERQQIEKQLRRYRALARARAEAESRHATANGRRSASLLHKRELPAGTPAERRFDPPPTKKGGGVDRGKGGAAQFRRQQGPPPPTPTRPIRKKK